MLTVQTVKPLKSKPKEAAALLARKRHKDLHSIRQEFLASTRVSVSIHAHQHAGGIEESASS